MPTLPPISETDADEALAATYDRVNDRYDGFLPDIKDTASTSGEAQ